MTPHFNYLNELELDDNINSSGLLKRPATAVLDLKKSDLVPISIIPTRNDAQTRSIVLVNRCGYITTGSIFILDRITVAFDEGNTATWGQLADLGYTHYAYYTIKLEV